MIKGRKGTFLMQELQHQLTLNKIGESRISMSRNVFSWLGKNRANQSSRV